MFCKPTYNLIRKCATLRCFLRQFFQYLCKINFKRKVGLAMYVLLFIVFLFFFFISKHYSTFYLFLPQLLFTYVVVSLPSACYRSFSKLFYNNNNGYCPFLVAMSAPSFLCICPQYFITCVYSFCGTPLLLVQFRIRFFICN